MENGNNLVIICFNTLRDYRFACVCNRQGGKIITPHYDTMMTSLTVVFLSDFRLNYDVYYSGIYYTTTTTAVQ